MNSYFLGEFNAGYPEAVQTEISHFTVDPAVMPLWESGLEWLGRPLSARLTSYAREQFLDVYYL